MAILRTASQFAWRIGRYFWPVLALVCFQSRAQQPLEYQVKAAFLLNFTKFIEWPASAFGTPDAPLTICILGADLFGTALDQIVAGEVVNGRKLAVQHINGPAAPRSCQVLYLSRSEREILKAPPGAGPGILTVGEGEGFTHDGGMISFVLEHRRVRFKINQTAAERAGLKLSSRLLSVAKSVEK